MEIEISSDLSRLRIAEVREMLSRSFWSPGITENEIRKGIANSALAVGAFLGNGRQVGFLRVISDKTRFAYLLDVIVSEDCRRRGIGQKMVRFALAHPELRDVYQWLLVTRDAQGVYGKCGFRPLPDPERWMSIFSPRPERPDFPAGASGTHPDE